MLSHSNLPNKLWAEAIATAAYLRNCSTTSANEEQRTLFEKWYGHKPKISHLRVFGRTAYSLIPNTERRKLDKKAQRMCFISYSKNPKGYGLIDLNTNKVVTRRDVVFNKTDFHFSKRTNVEGVSISPELMNGQLKMSLNQRHHHEHHNEQLNVQTITDILNLLTQPRLNVPMQQC